MRFLKLALVFILLFAFTKSHCQSSSIEVLSWNVFLRPSVMNDGQMNRVDEIGSYLLNSGADILVLQEIFHRKARRKLKKQLIEIYPYQTKKGPVSWIGIPSGVVFFSKMPILSEKEFLSHLPREQIGSLKRVPLLPPLTKMVNVLALLVHICRPG